MNLTPTPQAAILFVVIAAWLNAVRSLTPEFEAANAKMEAESAAAESKAESNETKA